MLFRAVITLQPVRGAWADDEPMFTLLARDPVAATMVRIWIKLRLLVGKLDSEKLTEATLCADKMDRWRIAQQAQGRFTDE